MLAALVVLAALACGRGRAALTPLAAAVAAAAIAVVAAYRAEGLVVDGASAEALRSSGGPVLTAVILCTIVAAGSPGCWLKHPRHARRRTARAGPAARPRRRRHGGRARRLRGARGGRGAAARLRRGEGARSRQRGPDIRDRLTDASLNGRREQWAIAFDEFSAHPLLGAGAGNLEVAWYRVRTLDRDATDANSLYIEFAGERGLLGLALLLAALGVGFAALARRGPALPVVAVTGAAAAWLAHAAVTPDWEVPATSLWLFAVLGAACAWGAPAAVPARRPVRVAAALAVAAALFVPVQTARSQAALTDAQDAFERGDCAATRERARDATGAAGWRPLAYALQAICDAREGEATSARRYAAEALDRDPENWRLLWIRAVADAAAGAGAPAEFAVARERTRATPCSHPGPPSPALRRRTGCRTSRERCRWSSRARPTRRSRVSDYLRAMRRRSTATTGLGERSWRSTPRSSRA